MGCGIGALTSTCENGACSVARGCAGRTSAHCCSYIVLPGSTAEMRFYATEPHLPNYLVLVCIFATNALFWFSSPSVNK